MQPNKHYNNHLTKTEQYFRKPPNIIKSIELLEIEAFNYYGLHCN